MLSPATCVSVNVLATLVVNTDTWLVVKPVICLEPNCATCAVVSTATSDVVKALIWALVRPNTAFVLKFEA